MVVKLCGLMFSMAVICFEYRPIEAMVGLWSNPQISPPRPRPVIEPWMQNVTLPYQNDPPTIQDSLAQLEVGLKRDPCIKYCDQNVIESMILKDCGDMMAAVKFLAENEHPRVKRECATARDHKCKYTWLRGYSCQFKVTKVSGRKTKETRYKLKHCLAENP